MPHATATLETIVRSYYDHVDAHRLADAVRRGARLRAAGHSPITGIAALRRFYEQERIIDSGTHTLDQVLAGADWVAVRGRFDGRLRDGQ
jgi:uncharacterized protein